MKPKENHMEVRDGVMVNHMDWHHELCVYDFRHSVSQQNPNHNVCSYVGDNSPIERVVQNIGQTTIFKPAENDDVDENINVMPDIDVNRRGIRIDID